MKRRLVYQIFGADGEPVSDPDWMTSEEADKLAEQYPEGCYAGIADGIEAWEG